MSGSGCEALTGGWEALPDVRELSEGSLGLLVVFGMPSRMSE